MGFWIGVMTMVSAAFTGETFSRMMPVEYPWEYRYGGVWELSDGSIAVVNGMIMEDFEVFHFDDRGNLIYIAERLSVPDRALESGGWLVPLSEGGFYMVSFSEPRATGVNSDIAVFKISDAFTVDWMEIIGENSEQVFTGFGAAGTPGGGVAVLGGEGYAGLNAFLRGYGSDGELVWEHVYQEEDGYLPLSVCQVDDGNLVLLSHRWEEKTTLQKFDSRGNMNWELDIPVPGVPGPVSFCSMDTGYGIYYSGGGEETRSGVTVTVTHDGEIIGTGMFNHGMVLQDVLIEEDSQVVLVGTRVINGINCAVIEARDYQGNLTWKRRLEGYGEGGFTGICPSERGGYLVSGYCISEDETAESGAVLIRTDPRGSVAGGENPAQIPMPR